MSNTEITVLAAAESNNLTQLKDALDVWSTQEFPNRQPPKVSGQPLPEFQSALQVALRLRHVDVADELLHRGCWISPRAVVAASAGCNEQSGWDTRSFDVLFKRGWDINECLGHIGDALILAVGPSKLPLVTYLLNNGANPNANRRGHTNSVLETAAISASPEIVQLLLKYGAEIYNRSALHEAASYGRVQICRILIEAGDDVNAIPDNEDLFENATERDDWGTPLHGAAGNGHIECISFLLEKSARKDIRNLNGLTPGEVARRRGHTECAALLV